MSGVVEVAHERGEKVREQRSTRASMRLLGRGGGEERGVGGIVTMHNGPHDQTVSRAFAPRTRVTKIIDQQYQCMAGYVFFVPCQKINK